MSCGCPGPITRESQHRLSSNAACWRKRAFRDMTWVANNYCKEFGPGKNSTSSGSSSNWVRWVAVVTGSEHGSHSIRFVLGRCAIPFTAFLKNRSSTEESGSLIGTPFCRRQSATTKCFMRRLQDTSGTFVIRWWNRNRGNHDLSRLPQRDQKPF